MSEQLKDLTTDDILAADDLTLEPEDVPEWNGRVYIRVMSAQEAGDYAEQMSDLTKRKQAMMRLLAYTLCDAKGNKLIPTDKMDQFRKKSVKVYMRLQKRALKLNGFLEDEKQRKELEAALKND